MSMPKEFILHIGFPKNASTYLQKFVFPLFDSNDCYYVGRDASEYRPLQNIFKTINHCSPIDYDIGTLKDELALLLEKIHQNKIILSNEAIIGNMFDSFRNGGQIASQLKLLLGNPKIILIFRRQDKLAESMYRTMVRMGYFHSFEKYMRFYQGEFNTPEAESHYIRYRLIPAPFLDLRSLNYFRRIGFYQQMLGKENVLALPMEMIEQEFDSFVARLSEFIGSPLQSQPLQDRYNARYPVPVIKLATFLNRISLTDTNGIGFLPLRRKPDTKKPEDRTIFDKIITRLDIEYLYLFLRTRIKDNRKEISPLVSEKIREKMADDNRRLSTLLGIDLQAYGYY